VEISIREAIKNTATQMLGDGKKILRADDVKALLPEDMQEMCK
jgi:hypothetical protein